MIKISAVRFNGKLGLVQIKTNKGPNITLEGDKALGFKARRNHHIDMGCNLSDANVKAALEYIDQGL